MNGSNFVSGHRGAIYAIVIAGALLLWLLIMLRDVFSQEGTVLANFLYAGLGMLQKTQQQECLPEFPHRAFSRIMRILYGILALLVIIVTMVAALWFTNVRQAHSVANIIKNGDRNLAPYIAHISKTSWFIPTTFGAEAKKADLEGACATGAAPTSTTQHHYSENLHAMLQTYPHVREYIFTYTQSGRAYTLSHTAQGEDSERVFEVMTPEFRTRELVASLLQDSEIGMDRIEKYHDGTMAIPYTVSLCMTEGPLVGSATVVVALEGFFKGFEATRLKNLFVVDNEGHYLWHVDSKKRHELAEGRESSFFTDYPEAYPDILAGRGERRVKDGGAYIEVRPLHVAFEAVVDGAIKKINTQNVSPQHYAWFIGYEE